VPYSSVDLSGWPTFSPTTYQPTTPPPTEEPTTYAPTEEPTTQAPVESGGPCTEHGWHINLATDDGCSNDDEFVQQWLDPSIKDRMFFPTSQACCEALFKGKKCHVYGCAGWVDDHGSTPTVPTPAAAVEDDLACEGYHGWHINRAKQDGCTDDVNYPEAWLEPLMKNNMFKPTAEACCAQLFPNKDCEVYDTGCGGSAPEATCGEHGWHIDRENNDGCTNDENIAEAWLHPSTKDRMFKATSKECCDIFFPQGCKIYDCGGSSPEPAQEPSAGPVKPSSFPCGDHGWHVDRANNDGCTNDDNIVKAWINPYAKMFHSSSKLCCDDHFKGRVCNVYDCNGSAPAVEPAPGPIPAPEPTLEPTPWTISSAKDFSEDFEGGDISSTKFTTSGLAWTIDDEHAFRGTKSVKNALTSRGQSSTLTLTLDFPSDGVLIFELRHDIFMPWAQFEVRRNDDIVIDYQGHEGKSLLFW